MKYIKEFYSFSKTPIDITTENYEEAMSFRQRFPSFRHIGIATFLTTVWLWRVIDEFEFNDILKYNKIKGGDWSVKPERIFGASFTGCREDAVNFGLAWKKNGRLKGQLYIIGINAEDKEFLQLTMEERLAEQGLEYKVGDFVIDTKLGNTGLGFSVRNVNLNNIRHIYKLDDDAKLIDITHEYDKYVYQELK